MKAYHFPVIITQDEDNIYLAQVPSLTGCHTQAKTLPVLYKRISEAIELALEVQKSKRVKILQDRFIGVQQIQITI